jgi:hypothetical protein
VWLAQIIKFNYPSVPHRTSQSNMSVYLKSTRTDKFVEGPELWTEQPEKARQFGGSTDALFFCCRHHLADMEILGRFADPRNNFTVPLREHGFE